MDHNYLRRIFRHRRNSDDEEASADMEDTKQKPKLERRNALKNIEYDPLNSSSSSVSSSDGIPSKLRTRSLDINPFDKNTSFRIEGIEGEFDRLCETLGLSGPEDFAIPAAAWEARKARSSSDIFPRSRFSKIDVLTKPEKEEEGLEATVRVNDEAAVLVDLNTLTLNDSKNCRNSLDVGTFATASCGVDGGGAAGAGGGIKGARPPLLTPPPLKSRYVDDMSSASTWDIMRSLAPEERGSSSCPVRLLDSTSSDKEDELGLEGEEFNDGEIGGREKEHENGARLGETAVMSDSPIFLTSNDEDSSSATTETTYNISPEGCFGRNITSWQRGDIIGSGSFGTVYEAYTDDGFFFAVKEISLLDQSQQSIQQLEQEIALLREFEHENIVQYLGTDKHEGKLCIFLELVTRGSLVNVYRKYHLGDSQVSAYTRQILSGLKYLHDRNVVHRDIKCANILVHTSGSVKLADFGLAKAIKLNDAKSCKGTAFWMAPEVVNRKMHGYGIAADIWSLGCTVLEMLTRVLPYSPLEPMQAVFRIGQGKPPPIPDSLSRDARDFICQCLQVNPENRPTAAQLLNHSFVQRLLPTSSVSGSPLHHNSRRS
ncbi:mitogen-activated protein kinase kinase kinase 1-like [Telopea speciosissima]|uniref:mitogen-activated protein kinase kinase kinase 1-like n=1 Tax=Telopea speciosissima TaxID=54955 RepID=UPI001CC53261|nr:mitogen-activated protein kinase kinase kinase 1-like [Telopea speciosissima]